MVPKDEQGVSENSSFSVRGEQDGADVGENYADGEKEHSGVGGSGRGIFRGNDRTLWAWSSLSLRVTGGILRQLISNLRNQLAEDEDSIVWYQDEERRYLAQAEKARQGAEWHRLRMQKTKEEIANFEALLQSVEETLESEEGDDEIEQG